MEALRGPLESSLDFVMVGKRPPMPQQGDMVEGGDQRRDSEGSWWTCNTMISLQRAEFFV
jgi:hypothetical protein